MSDEPQQIAGGDSTESVLTDMAKHLLEPGHVTTWLNHWSLLNADWDALQQVDTIGIDGTLLQVVIQSMGAPIGRSSADLVLPIVFQQLLAVDVPVALIGAQPGVAEKAAARLAPRSVFTCDGYEGLAALRENPQALIDAQPRLIVVGLGAGLQERVACELHDIVPEASICTAGGWIDQFAQKEQYFPPVIHQLRLGWAWRIAQEPRRLAKRYTVDAVVFARQSRPLIRRLARFCRPSSYALHVRPGHVMTD